MVDTTLTVDEWNALPDHRRRAIAVDAWQTAAQADNGGMSVLTAGAVDL